MYRFRFLMFLLCALTLISFVSCTEATGANSSHNDTNSAQAELNEVSPKDARYVASKKSDKFHRLDCRFAANIKEANIVYYQYRSDAITDGKEPCATCEP